MSNPPRTSIVLRALSGEPLKNEPVKSIVESTAWAIGERTGIAVVSVQTLPDRAHIVLECSRLESIGFAAELRRLTQRWYEKKFPGSGHLWGPDPKNPAKPDSSDEKPWRSEHEDDDTWWRGGENDLGPPG